jgi:hypothetical protein
MIFINMQTLNTKFRLLCASTLTALTLAACQQAPVVVPIPAPMPVPIALIPPVPQPVIIEDPLVVQIKALDRPNIEGRINLIGQYARHYPTHFDSVRARHAAEAEVKDLLNTVNPIAKAPKATHNELVQAFKVNGMARNLDVGSNTTTNADNFIRRALNKAAKSNFYEAHLSLANAYLGLGKNDQAIAELRTYQKLVPTDTRVLDMIDAVKQNKAAIW